MIKARLLLIPQVPNSPRPNRMAEGAKKYRRPLFARVACLFIILINRIFCIYLIDGTAPVLLLFDSW